MATKGPGGEKSPKERRGATFDTVCEIARALPGSEEGTSYGTPSFRVRGKFFLRLKEDGETVVLKVGFDAREMLLAADPDAFYTTPHYDGYPAVLVRLPRIQPSVLREVVEQAWRENAPARLRAKREAESEA